MLGRAAIKMRMTRNVFGFIVLCGRGNVIYFMVGFLIIFSKKITKSLQVLNTYILWKKFKIVEEKILYPVQSQIYMLVHVKKNTSCRGSAESQTLYLKKKGGSCMGSRFSAVVPFVGKTLIMWNCSTLHERKVLGL